MTLWRISKYADLSGTGGLYVDGRWHSLGKPVVYCAEHPAGALLEVLVHTDPRNIPDEFQLIEIDFPEDMKAFEPHVTIADLHDMRWTQKVGDEFLTRGDHCLMRVPSAVLPLSRNIIINPRHADAARLSIVSVSSHPFDSRLLR